MKIHLTDRQLLSYLAGDLPVRQRERAEAHLQSCSACRRRLESFARTATDLDQTLQAVAEQIPLASSRSWDAVSRQWKRMNVGAVREPSERRREGPPSLGQRGATPDGAGAAGRTSPRRGWVRPLVRQGAVLAVLAIVVAGLAGLIHTLAITGPALTRPTPTPRPTLPLSPSPAPGPLPRSYGHWPAKPVSLLVLGSDGESDASNAVDALLLLYLDTESERAFVLSIPRELYVEVPGYGAAYAGTVYRLGEQEGAPGGLTLVQETISATLSLEVNHTALVRFDGFIALIDAIGGVDVDVPAPIEDPAFPDGRGGTGLVVIPAGRQHLDGEQALRYARTRVEPVTGFDRAFRQRQLVLAVHDRVTRLDLLPGLIAQAPAFWSAVSQGLETDLPLSDGIDLALLANRLSSDDIEAVALDDCCAVEGALGNGERVLLPQPDEITALLNTLLGEER